jgi:large subunit ribosomal protein L24
MQQKMNVRKGDKVVVTTGKYAGVKGEVIKAMPKTNRVIVSGVNKVRRHMKPSHENPEGGVIEKESSIHVSNVQHEDPKTGKPTRIGYRILKDGTKVRYAKKSGEEIQAA